MSMMTCLNTLLRILTEQPYNNFHVLQVLNKYFPPDFDPELVPRNKKPRDRQIEVKMLI